MTFERRELPYSWAVVKKALQDRAERLVRRFGFHEQPDGDGRIWPRNPWRNDRRPGSFNIAVRDIPNFPAGSWFDHATKEGGDIFDLIARCERHADKMSTYWWSLEYLGWGRGEVRTKAQADQDREREEADRKAAEAKAAVAAEDKAARLFKHWLGLPPLAGTLAERYLVEARGIELSRLKHPPGALRFNPACDHIDEATGEVTTWPAMVSAMTRGKKLVGLHRTWITPDGLAKAPVTPAKKMSGSVRGAAIRLSSGPSGLSPSMAAKKGRADPLVIGEGIETTLTAAVARPDYRAWAAGSLSLMGLLEWPACASAAVLLQDADWKPEAVRAFERVVEHWEGQRAGRPLKIVRA